MLSNITFFLYIFSKANLNNIAKVDLPAPWDPAIINFLSLDVFILLIIGAMY